MLIRDMHVHTLLSYDGNDNIISMCDAALNKGLSAIAITNHCDYDCIKAGLYPRYDLEKDRMQVMDAKERYRGRLDVIWGVELGQPHFFPEETREFIKSGGFEFILCSLHNTRNAPDYYFIDYSKMPEQQCMFWYQKYMEEVEKLVGFGDFDAIGHIGYPLRYMKRGGKSINLKPFRDGYEKIFKKMIKNSIALEVNTSGLRQGFDATIPDLDIVRLYRECGGELIGTGSDAHFASDVGADIMSIYGILKAMGFKYINEYNMRGVNNG